MLQIRLQIKSVLFLLASEQQFLEFSGANKTVSCHSEVQYKIVRMAVWAQSPCRSVQVTRLAGQLSLSNIAILPEKEKNRQLFRDMRQPIPGFQGFVVQEHFRSDMLHACVVKYWVFFPY